MATVRELIAGGVDVNLPDGSGTRPLTHAQRRNFTEIAELLRAADAEP